MKISIFIIPAILFCTFLKAQNVETLSIHGRDLPDFNKQEEYKYPEFSPAHAYLNNGDSAIGKFNFDYFDQTMRYKDEKNDTSIIRNANEIKFVTILTDTFFYDKGFYEWVASSANARLALRRTYKVVERENVGPYGIASPTRNVQTIGKVFTGRSYDLPPDEVVMFERRTTYYISPIKKGYKNDFVVANKSNLSDMYPKKDIEGYIKEHKLNLTKIDDLITVFVYANTPDKK